MKMNMRSRSAVQLILVAALASVSLTDAATYTVGGGSWTLPSTPGQYTTWASTINFTVGDVLVFNFAAPAHDVATVTKVNYDACEDDNPIALVTQGPANVTLTASGMNYFICTIDDHCEAGQKLAVNVTATTNGTSPTPSTSPPPPTGATSPPTPTGANSPPPPTGTTSSPPPPPADSSATAVAGGSFIAGLIAAVAFGMTMN